MKIKTWTFSILALLVTGFIIYQFLTYYRIPKHDQIAIGETIISKDWKIVDPVTVLEANHRYIIGIRYAKSGTDNLTHTGKLHIVNDVGKIVLGRQWTDGADVSGTSSIIQTKNWDVGTYHIELYRDGRKTADVSLELH